MKRIYTRTGDKGMTSIHGRIRVPKTDIRIEANGTLDELNVEIGMARAMMPPAHRWQQPLKEIQVYLMTAMSLVATKSEMRHDNPNILPCGMVEQLEQLIDTISAEKDAPEYFILPGGNLLSAQLHRCRVTARRAERRLWSLDAEDPVPDEITTFVNRLSDLFFTMARREMLGADMEEERWKAFSYKRSKKQE